MDRGQGARGHCAEWNGKGPRPHAHPPPVIWTSIHCIGEMSKQLLAPLIRVSLWLSILGDGRGAGAAVPIQWGRKLDCQGGPAARQRERERGRERPRRALRCPPALTPIPNGLDDLHRDTMPARTFFFSWSHERHAPTITTVSRSRPDQWKSCNQVADGRRRTWDLAAI